MTKFEGVITNKEDVTAYAETFKQELSDILKEMENDKGEKTNEKHNK